MNRLIKFGIVGMGAATVHLLTLYVLVHFLAAAPLIGNILAFCIAFFFSYAGQANWTFADRQLEHKKAMRRFLSIQLFSNFILNQGLFYLLISYSSLNYLLACFFVLIIVAGVTYTLSFSWGFGR